MSGTIDDDLPGGPIRTLSAQRVTVAFTPGGSIIKQPPPPPLPDVDPETVAPTVAAPVSGSAHPSERDATEAAPSVALEGLPVDAEALAESAVTKDPHDDERPADIEHLTDKGVRLNEQKALIGGIPKEDVWALIRRFDKASTPRVCPDTHRAYYFSCSKFNM